MYARRSNYDPSSAGPADLDRALAGYFGLVSFLDEQVGKILAALEEAGLAATTRVAYTSDHGDNLGFRGLWGKATMYEESAGVPLLLGGPEVPAGAAYPTPVTLLDPRRPSWTRAARAARSRRSAFPAPRCST
jgi:choline-sulfatase